ncbi:hypothetical protein NEOLEDRAFT_1155191 [Neolentinus lepideus HHB14362 ss-1]|uniref:Uncharacterized protein n=1 Tax=Neolentinus lepideus HHB14362 ss-1 TaxID=1314782 RepID=A0A165TTF6_9AGAM|nr:hypothetical protein NEOLEDRAFT_1155191 [Neolentinus lepideus HHB14362 ss-1]
MIIDKVPLPEDPTPAEAPPSYDSLVAGPSSATAAEEKPNSSSSNSSSPQGDSLSSAKSKLQTSHLKSRSWLPFNLGATRTARQVRTTILSLIHGVITQLSEDDTNGNSDESAIGILESCADTSIMHDISFSSLLQEKSIEGHTPIYWAILKRPIRRSTAHNNSSSPRPARSLSSAYTPFDEEPNDNSSGSERAVVLTLLKFSAPLTEATKSDIRLACMLNSDDALFQCIRSTEAFAPVVGTDQILFGTATPDPTDMMSELGRGIGRKDRVRVVHMTDDDAAFAAHLEVPLFQKRMRVGGRIPLDFIGKGRMFRLTFAVATAYDAVAGKVIKPGSWLVSLEILEDSPPTWIDSRLVIRESRYTQSSPPDTTSTSGSPRSKAKPKPTITLRLKSSTQLTPGRHTGIVQAGLDESLMGSNLMYDGTSYFTPNGTLRAMLEARLVKSDTDCIIC